MDFSGGGETVDVTEWYAKGLGVIQARGERVETDEAGVTVRREANLIDP